MVGLMTVGDSAPAASPGGRGAGGLLDLLSSDSCEDALILDGLGADFKPAGLGPHLKPNGS